MESPVVVDKPPEYHGNLSNEENRGFPFEEEEGDAWSELAARHPDIAARLRQRPAVWARKRRPSREHSDFDERFTDFDRFPFNDIPPEFREHFPSHWNRRYSGEPRPSFATSTQPQTNQQTTATQTEPEAGPSAFQETNLPHHGLRNTVDLGQKSPADPSVEDRQQRSRSEPPAANQNRMSGQNHQEPEQGSNVRHIPIFVEGRDKPVINKSAASVNEQQRFKEFFPDDEATCQQTFARNMGVPLNKGFRQGPQPYVQQKVYPQTAFARGASPQRSQSPKPQHQEEHYVKVPVHHERSTPKAERKQQEPMQQSPQPKPRAPVPEPEEPPRHTPSPKPQPAPVNDPITVILGIQTDVLNLMSEVENFSGTKKDKQYLFLDEMLTRNLIKLDNIETDGKENIRLARKEAIKCIQKCIAVLEAKAEAKNAQDKRDVELQVGENEASMEQDKPAEVPIDGTVKMQETPKENSKIGNQAATELQNETKSEKNQPDSQDDANLMQVSDTRPEECATDNKLEANKTKVDKKASPKKTKNVKKRDKSKDKKDKDSNKEQKLDNKEQMQVDEKGDQIENLAMETDCATASQS